METPISKLRGGTFYSGNFVLDRVRLSTVANVMMEILVLV